MCKPFWCANPNAPRCPPVVVDDWDEVINNLRQEGERQELERDVTYPEDIKSPDQLEAYRLRLARMDAPPVNRYRSYSE